MMTLGIIFLTIGLLFAALKGYVVWAVAHDLHGGGGVPTLDFPLFCPIPLAFGSSLVLKALGKSLPGFGFIAYVCLAVFFGFLLWLFDRLGRPARKRQGARIE